MTDPQQQAMPLLPCPFCGCECNEPGKPTPHADGCWFKVDRAWRQAIADKLDFSLTQDVIDAWNRRALAASAPGCQSKQPQDLRPDQFCADLTCGFLGGCSRKGGEAPGCVEQRVTQEMIDAAAMLDCVKTINSLACEHQIRYGSRSKLPGFGAGVQDCALAQIFRAMLAASPSVAEAGGTIKEDLIVDAAQEDADTRASMDLMADLLTRTVNALRGDPGPLRRWPWHDLPERAAEATKAQTPVAWRWRPSPHWSEHIIAQDPNRAEEAKTYGMKVEALVVIKEAGQ